MLVALSIGLGLSALGLQDPAPVVLSPASIEAWLDELADLGRDAHYGLEREEVRLDPHHELGRALVELAGVEGDAGLAALDLEALREAAHGALELAREERPPSYRESRAEVTWTPWRRVVRHLPVVAGELVQPSYVHDGEHLASYQQRGGLLRFSRSTTAELPFEPVLPPELFHGCLPDEEAREKLARSTAWTARELPGGLRHLRAHGPGPVHEWLHDPGGQDAPPRPVVRRVGRYLVLFSFGPEGEPEEVLELDLRRSAMALTLSRFVDWTREVPPSALVLEIDTPEAIALPVPDPAARVDTLPEEWRGLVVVRRP